MQRELPSSIMHQVLCTYDRLLSISQLTTHATVYYELFSCVYEHQAVTAYLADRIKGGSDRYDTRQLSSAAMTGGTAAPTVRGHNGQHPSQCRQKNREAAQRCAHIQIFMLNKSKSMKAEQPPYRAA
eukprot:6174951-Pleurochrysis_carterae.AAC.1